MLSGTRPGSGRAAHRVGRQPGAAVFFHSDVDPDGAIVFKGYHSAPGAPFGCLHGAFRHPDPGPVAMPRAGAETRVFVLT